MEHLLADTGIKPLLIKNSLQWRYATKVFDTGKKIPQDKLDLLLKALRLSPSSLGLQPWKFVLVKKRTLRNELKKYAMGQHQVSDAPVFLVLCSLKTINGRYVNEWIDYMSDQREENLEPLKAYLMSFIESMSKDDLKQWMTNQVYLALGFLLSTCAMLHIDTCPIESFDKKQFNKILGLDRYQIESVVAVAIGYRGGDPESQKIKVHWPEKDLFITV